MQINEPRKIYTLKENEHLPTREDGDYIFLGWAREPEFEDNDSSNPPTVYHDVGYDDLYIRWIPDEAEEGTGGNRAAGESGHYEAKNKDDKWVEVTEVSADEADPYQAYYAVWAPYFNVVYSSEPDKVYQVPIVDSKASTSYNLVDGMKGNDATKGYELPGVHDDCYYGGYYDSLPGEDGAWQWTVKDKNGNDVQNVHTAEKGTEFKSPEAGKTYYVKEVKKDLNHLRTIYRYTYKLDTGRLTWFCVISSIDDKNYNFAGYEVNGSESISTDGIKKKIKITNEAGTISDDDPNATIDRTNFGVNTVETPARLVYHVFTPVPTDKTITVTPCWITPDGITVKGITRSFTFSADPKITDASEV
jgi:hypothetical protein